MVDPMVRQSYPPNASPGLGQASLHRCRSLLWHGGSLQLPVEEGRPEPITLTKFSNQLSLSTISGAKTRKGWKEARRGERHSHPAETLDLLVMPSYPTDTTEFREGKRL